MKASKFSCSVVAIISACLFLAYPPLTHAEDLEDIFKLAEENDPTIRAAVATRDSAQEFVNISRGEFLPQIRLGAEYLDIDTTNADNNTTALNDGAGTVYSLNLVQPIYDARNFSQHRLNKNFAQQADADFKIAQQDQIMRTATQYFRVLGAMDNLEFSRAEMQSNERQLEQIKQRFDVGLVAITDVHEAQARYDLSRSQFIEAENILDNEVEALRKITGRYHKQLAPLREKTPLEPPDPNDIEHWTNLALQQNPALVSSRFFVEQAQNQVSVQRSDHHPTLELAARYAHADEDLQGEYDRTTVGINFSMNLFAGGSISAGVRQAQQELTRAKQNLESASRDTQEAVRRSFLGVKSAISQVSALRQAVISSQSRLKATEAGFDVGTRTTVDVLNARSELFDSERLYARARYDYILQTMSLRQAAGMLETQDIAAVNNLLRK
ncbi:MAG TPA: TolC family outer membrane protein [Gammaproteobacteria bacterium]